MTNAPDPITLEVVCEALIAIVREMRASIIRASYSPAIYELDDFSCAVFNSKAEMLAQSEDHPGHVIPMPWSVRCAMEDFETKINPGDIILLNDAYRGGTHLNDITLLFPVFDRDRLTMLPCVRSHWADVGGMTPGSYSGLATSIYQEGLCIPPTKLYERGVVNASVMRLIENNMRLPDQRMGDLRAMIGACQIAERRIHSMTKKYGLETVLACVNANLDRCEKRMRARIGVLPDGTYTHEDYLEYYDQGRFDPVLMRLSLTVHGDEITADFEGSNAQVPGVVNSSLAVAGAGVFVALKSTLDPGGAVNAGTFRPIHLKAPEASIVNVRRDAPAGAHGEVRKRAVSVMLGCLSQMVPSLVSGDLCGTSFPNSMGGNNRKRGRSYVYVEVPAGGNGGFEENDGSSAFVNVDFGNIRSIYNVESLETDMPFLVERSVLRTDSGGPGSSRGGLGMRREIRLLEDEATYSVLSDRAVIPPFGVLGGRSAAPVKVSITSGNEERALQTPGKATGRQIGSDDIVVMESAGGGGYGDPLSRDFDKVCRDVIGGYISMESAREDYGVVFLKAGEVDRSRSKDLRDKLRKQTAIFKVQATEKSPYEGIKGRHRRIHVNPGDAVKHELTDGDLIELFGKHPTPLRAWISVDASVPVGQIPLDAFGQQVLGLVAGESATLRKLKTIVRPGERVQAQ
jgi:N-methylhydantoinase B